MGRNKIMKVQLTPKKEVFNFCEPYIIAEIGANHNGDMDLAKKMIDLFMNTSFEGGRHADRVNKISCN